MYFVAADLVNDPATHMTDGSPKSGLPVDLVGTLSDGCQPFFAFLALKKLDNHLDAHGLLEFAQERAEHIQEACRALLEANAAKPKPSDQPRKLDLTVPGAHTRPDRHHYGDDGLHIEDVRNCRRLRRVRRRVEEVGRTVEEVGRTVGDDVVDDAPEAGGVRRNVREGQDP